MQRCELDSNAGAASFGESLHSKVIMRRVEGDEVWLEEETLVYWELKELGEEKFKLMHPDDEFEFFGDKYGGTVVAVDPDVPLMPVQKINDIKRDILDIWGV